MIQNRTRKGNRKGNRKTGKRNGGRKTQKGGSANISMPRKAIKRTRFQKIFGIRPKISKPSNMRYLGNVPKPTEIARERQHFLSKVGSKTELTPTELQKYHNILFREGQMKQENPDAGRQSILKALGYKYNPKLLSNQDRSLLGISSKSPTNTGYIEIKPYNPNFNIDISNMQTLFSLSKRPGRRYNGFRNEYRQKHNMIVKNLLEDPEFKKLTNEEQIQEYNYYTGQTN